MAAPPPAGVRRKMERNRQKPVGRDKSSLREQQTKGTVTTMIQKKGNIQNKPAEQNRSLGPNRCCALLSGERVSIPQLPPTRTQLDGTWYGICCSVWPGGVSPPGCAPYWSR